MVKFKIFSRLLSAGWGALFSGFLAPALFAQAQHSYQQQQYYPPSGYTQPNAVQPIHPQYQQQTPQQYYTPQSPYPAVQQNQQVQPSPQYIQPNNASQQSLPAQQIRTAFKERFFIGVDGAFLGGRVLSNNEKDISDDTQEFALKIGRIMKSGRFYFEWARNQYLYDVITSTLDAKINHFSLGVDFLPQFGRLPLYGVLGVNAGLGVSNFFDYHTYFLNTYNITVSGRAIGLNLGAKIGLMLSIFEHVQLELGAKGNYANHKVDIKDTDQTYQLKVKQSGAYVGLNIAF